MAYLGKEFTFERDENHEAFLDVLGANLEGIKQLLGYKPNEKIEKTGDGYKLTFVIPSGSNNEVNFKLGETTNEVVNGNLKAKSVFTLEGDTLTLVQDFGDNRIITFKRVYSDNSLKIVATFSKWDGVATRWFKAV